MNKLTKRLSQKDKLIKKCADVLAEHTCIFVPQSQDPNAFSNDCKRMEEKLKRWNPSDRDMKRYIKWRKYCANFEWGKITNA